MPLDFFESEELTLKLSKKAKIITAVVLAACVVGTVFYKVYQDNHKPEDPPTVEAKPLITSQVILDNKGVKMTAKSLAFGSGTEGTTVRILIENDTEHTITIPEVQLGSVNGVMIDAKAGWEVPAGKKMHENIEFDASQLSYAGITSVKTVEFKTPIYSVSDDGKETTLLYSPSVIHLTTSVNPDFVQPLNTDGYELVSRDGFKAVFQAYDKTRHNGYIMVQNTTPYCVDVAVNSLKVNGVEIETTDDLLNEEVNAGMVKYVTVNLGDAEPQTIAISFVVKDSQTEDILFTTDEASFSFQTAES